MTMIGHQISRMISLSGVPDMPEVMNRHMPNGGVDRPTIMLKQMMRPKWMMLMPIASATGHRIGIMTSWMTEVSTRQPRIRMMMTITSSGQEHLWHMRFIREKTELLV